jgi:thioredoxin 1
MNLIASDTQFRKVTNREKAVLIYFSHEQCSVCKVLKPKIDKMLSNQFPEMPMYYCDTIKQSEVAAQNRIFAVPTVLVFFDGRETFRLSRNIGLAELQASIQRPYSLMF